MCNFSSRENRLYTRSERRKITCWKPEVGGGGGGGGGGKLIMPVRDIGAGGCQHCTHPPKVITAQREDSRIKRVARSIVPDTF